MNIDRLLRALEVILSERHGCEIKIRGTRRGEKRETA